MVFSQLDKVCEILHFCILSLKHKVTFYGNGSWNGIIEDTVLLGGIIDDSVSLGLILSDSPFCALVVNGKKGNILISLLKQESKIPQYLKYEYGDSRSLS
jgi:hypothetical protein